MKFKALESNVLFLGEGILLNTISHPKNVIWRIGGPFLMGSTINIFLFSRFKHFQLHVVDCPPPLEMVSLTQDQALLISHRKLPSNGV